MRKGRVRQENMQNGLRGSGIENEPSLDEISEPLQATPKDFDAWLRISVAGQEAAELGNPADGQLQGRGRGRRELGFVDKAKKGFPFRVLERNGTR